MNNTFFFVIANYVRVDRDEADKKAIYSLCNKEAVGFILKVTTSQEDRKEFVDKYLHASRDGYYIKVDSLKELGVDTEQLATYTNSRIKPGSYWVRILT